MASGKISEYMAALLSSPDLEDAVDWLNRGGDAFFIGEMTHADSVKLVEHVYDLGAVDVTVAEVARHAGMQSTDHVIVTLPNDPRLREGIFDWNNGRVEKLGIDPDEDEGQKYLLILFE